MSQQKDEDDVDPPFIHIITDSEDSNPLDNGFAGFSSSQKRSPTDLIPLRATVTARKKLKLDADKADVAEEVAIDIDSISTNPRRTRTKVSSDTSSKFPVSSPSDGMITTGNRKKYAKNTLPAGAFERMLNDISQSYPLMTFHDKLEKWKCCTDLSDVEDVNNFDDQFRKREQQYRKSSSGKRSIDKESPLPNYNYQHFRMIILESLKGSPIACTPSPDAVRLLNNADQPSCSKPVDAVLAAANAAAKPDAGAVIQYEKILCPSSESSATKASQSIRLHWTTDEDSVFRLNRLNPEIDKFSKLIKLRVDYKKEVNLKAKMNEIFKTPTVPTKYNCGCDSPEQRKSIEGAVSEGKPVEECAIEVPKVAERKIETRRSTGGKSADSKPGSGRKSTERRNSEKFPEVKNFQQDEFCNYLGLGMNGKVYSPTPTDNKRRSLRVRRQQPPVEPVKKKKEKKESKKDTDTDVADKEKAIEAKTDKKEEEEVTTTVNEIRNSLPTLPALTIKILERTTPDEQKSPRPKPPLGTITDAISKTPEIKILMQLRNSPTPQTPSTATTANSAPAPSRRIRRTRATSNGTSTCPRSSQSDESPTKATPRRRRLHHTRRTNNNNNNASDLSESLQSDPQVPEASPSHNGRASTVPSSEGKKEEIATASHPDCQVSAESLHKKFQRYLEESRKSKPSIFILDSIDNSASKATEEATPVSIELVTTEQPPKEEQPVKMQKWSNKKKILRRLLRKNGTITSSASQRILRNRTILRPLRIKISKHPMGKKVRAAKKKAMREQLVEKKKQHQESVSNEEEMEAELQPAEEGQSDKEECRVATVHHEKCVQTDNLVENTEEETSETAACETICPPVPPETKTEDVQIQTEPYIPPLPINFLSSPASYMKNPLTVENGPVAYAYYELDILTVVQDLMVTFWKTSKLIQVLSKSTCEWMYLGECKRMLFDEEICAPFKNRICVHNSIPIYMEMRAKELSKIRRDCNLVSVYVNVYYYHDEDLVAKSHSIQLDTVASLPQNVVFTTITDSRYFVMCWSQETILGKARSGLCKYSLTPHLDTLASIREFKSMRHEIRYLECTTDDNLIGFGETQVTLWDHRSGDILMNYDLDFQLGSNLGSIYYPSLEVGQDNTVLIFQKTAAQELSIIAINISHAAPSHRFVCTHTLPPEFADLQSSMRTDDYVILTNAQNQELWIDCSDPQYMMQVRTAEGQSRFYAHCKQNVIDIADEHLALESFSNFVLKMIKPKE